MRSKSAVGSYFPTTTRTVFGSLVLKTGWWIDVLCSVCLTTPWGPIYFYKLDTRLLENDAVEVDPHHVHVSVNLISECLVHKMPNIVYDVKLDFKDVLLRPKRSTLKSRSDVSIAKLSFNV